MKGPRQGLQMPYFWNQKKRNTSSRYVVFYVFDERLVASGLCLLTFTFRTKNNLFGSFLSKNIAAFPLVISSSINLLFLKSVCSIPNSKFEL